MYYSLYTGRRNRTYTTDGVRKVKAVGCDISDVTHNGDALTIMVEGPGYTPNDEVIPAFYLKRRWWGTLEIRAVDITYCGHAPRPVLYRGEYVDRICAPYVHRPTVKVRLPRDSKIKAFAS